MKKIYIITDDGDKNYRLLLSDEQLKVFQFMKRIGYEIEFEEEKEVIEL